MSLAKTHLSAIQSRIIVSLFQCEGRQQYVSNEAVLEKTGIAQSTWSEEQKRLAEMGVLEKKAFKAIRANNVCRIVNFRLTSKGRTVAFNLANISRMIVQQTGGDLFPLPISSAAPKVRLSEKDFEYDVLESIEIALDSFGINLVPLVKSRLGERILWEEVAKRPEILSAILQDLFGRDGSSTVELMITENLKSRFDLQHTVTKERDMSTLIAEFKRERVTENESAVIMSRSESLE